MGVARIVALLAALCVTLLIGVRAAMPPAVEPATAPATSFSAERAMTDIRAIAIRPHPTTSTDNARVRAYLVGRLRGLGIAAEERRYLIDPEGTATLRRWSGQIGVGPEMVDVVGVLPGRNPALPAVAMMAHYDTVWGSPGSGDDSAGVAAILETLRAIKARGPAARDILVLFTDGEEIGLSGARAFWPSDALARHVGVVINLEARGAGGRATMFETGSDNGAIVAELGRGAPTVANSMAVLAYRLMPNDTDLTPVRKLGLPGFNFAIMGRPQYYHSPRATVDRLDPRALQDLGSQALGLVSTLAFAPALPGRTPDAVFFDVAGHGLIHYAAGTGWWILLGAALALAGACWGAALMGRVKPVEVLHGMVAQIWLVAHAVLALTVFNLLSGSGHPNYYDRLAKLPGLEVQTILVCLAVLLGFFMLRRWPTRVAALMPALLLALAAMGAGRAARPDPWLRGRWNGGGLVRAARWRAALGRLDRGDRNGAARRGGRTGDGADGGLDPRLARAGAGDHGGAGGVERSGVPASLGLGVGGVGRGGGVGAARSRWRTSPSSGSVARCRRRWRCCCQSSPPPSGRSRGSGRRGGGCCSRSRCCWSSPAWVRCRCAPHPYRRRSPPTASTSEKGSERLFVDAVDAVDLAFDRVGDRDHPLIVLEDPADLAARRAE